jgi:hypothetical protein
MPVSFANLEKKLRLQPPSPDRPAAKRRRQPDTATLIGAGMGNILKATRALLSPLLGKPFRQEELAETLKRRSRGRARRCRCA